MTMFIKALRIAGLLIAACGILMSIFELLDVCEAASIYMKILLMNPYARTVAAVSNLPNLIDYVIKNFRGVEL